jgi:hypothetical protein
MQLVCVPVVTAKVLLVLEAHPEAGHEPEKFLLKADS